MVRYPVKIAREDESIIVTFPGFPGAHTFGHDEPEAHARAADASRLSPF